ncbi:testis-expressed protein 12 [Clinocottus analis]|uniref:testis-expressed protein 12 n=1 Tax=Clinocottus analis TaxID=304258 RepID=UPI0035BF0E4F
MAEKMIPPISNKRAVNKNKGSKQTSEEMERAPERQDNSPPKKKKSFATVTLECEGLFEATTAGASRDFSMMLSKFAEVFSERAAADTSQMKELQGLLIEAQDMESYLKEKKKRLRETLSRITERLLD